VSVADDGSDCRSSSAKHCEQWLSAVVRSLTSPSLAAHPRPDGETAATLWPTARGSVFFGDIAGADTLSRAVRNGRVKRLARGLFTTDVRADPVKLVARNVGEIVAFLVPDALIADRSAAEGGVPSGGFLTVVSNVRAGALELPGITVVPRPGVGPLADDLPLAGAGVRSTSEARTLVDNLAPTRGRARFARTLSRVELEDWLVRRSRRRPDDWFPKLRKRALEICDDLGVGDRRPLVEAVTSSARSRR
jgi:hypothetical protein